MNKTLKAYRNGVQFSTVQNITTPVFPITNMSKYIGNYNTQTTHSLTDGSLDEVRIYNRGLSVDEIAQHYNSTKAKFGL